MKTLQLSQVDKRIGGVCGGLGEYLGISSDILRIIFVLATVFGGMGLIVYVIMWAVLPKSEVGEIKVKKRSFKLYRSKENAMIAGICSGLSKIFQVDVSLIRILFLISIFFQGVGVAIYLGLWLVLPFKNNDIDVV